MQNIVTWGQNMSANIEKFACISMGGLFSGVPPTGNRSYLLQVCMLRFRSEIRVRLSCQAMFKEAVEQRHLQNFRITND